MSAVSPGSCDKLKRIIVLYVLPMCDGRDYPNTSAERLEYAQQIVN